MPSKKRVSVTLQFVRGQDDELIKWISQLENGTRNGVMKAALRDGLKLPARSKRVSADEQIQRKLDELEREYRAKMEWVDQWIAYLNQTVQSIHNAPPLPTLPTRETQDQVVEQVDQQELEQRRRKLKQAQW